MRIIYKISIPIIFLLCSSCSYNRELTGNCFKEQCNKKLPLKITLAPTQSLKNKYIEHKIALLKLNVRIDELLKESTRSMLECYYSKDNSEYTQGHYSDSDYDLYVNYNSTSIGSEHKTSLEFVFQDTKSGAMVTTYQYKDRIEYSPPVSAVVLLWITGLFFYLPSPITLPIAANICASALEDDVNKSIVTSISGISDQLKMDRKLLDYAYQKMNQQKSNE